MDHRIHSTNLYPVDSAIGYLWLIHWKVIYPLDSAFQPLRNRRLYFIFIYCVQNLTAWHRLSVRLLQEAITVIFFPCKRKFYWKSNNSTNKECCIAVVAWLLHPLGQLFFFERGFRRTKCPNVAQTQGYHLLRIWGSLVKFQGDGIVLKTMLCARERICWVCVPGLTPVFQSSMSPSN